ncbi:MAG: hypothetical protein JWR10_1901 [Rubritepida sp.]|nr:hypothetical protein [Rubritepida sp.]
MNHETSPDPRSAALAALPVALMGFTAHGTLSFVNTEMLRLLRVDAASLPVGAPEHDVFRLLAFHGVLGPGDPEHRLQEVLALDPAKPHRQLLRDVGGRALELRVAPLPAGGRVLAVTDVTELVQAREAAEAETRALSDIMSRLSTGVAQYDSQRRLARNNTAYGKLIGLDPRLLHAGISVPEIVQHQIAAGEFDAEAGRAVVERMAAYPQGMNWRRERTRADGRTLRFDNQLMPDGGWLAEITDITEKHATEQDARRRIALHDALMEALPVGVAVYGPDRTLTMVNPAYNRIMAHSPVVVGENLRDILTRRALEGEFGPCDPAVEVPRRLARVVAPHSFERRSPSGVATTHRSVPLPDGGHAMVVADVTALHAAQAESRVRAELLGTMMENTRHGIAMFDEGGTVVAANRLAAQLCGLPPEKFVAGVALADLRRLQVALGVHGDELTTDSFLGKRMGQELKGPDWYRRRTPSGAMIEIITDRLPDGGFVRSYTDVSAQVAAETEATARAETLQSVLDNMRHGIMLFDGDGRLLTANALAAEFTGVPASSLVPGAHFDELRDLQAERGEHGAGEAAKRYREIRDHEPWKRQGHYTRRRPDGTIIEVRTDLTPGGGCVRSFTDITALTEAQADAAARAAMVQAMLDNMRHGIALFDSGRRLLAANQLCGELMGLGTALKPGMSHAEILAAQAATGEFGPASAAEPLVRDILGRHISGTRHRRRRRPDGTELEVVASPVPDGGFVLTLTDITARVLAEREAERRADVLAATLNAAPQGIQLFDANGRVIAANDIAARVAGFPGGMSLVGMAHRDIVAKQRELEGATSEEDAIETQRYMEVDRRKPHRYQRRRADGTVLDVNSEPMPDGGYVVSISDVTELVVAREQAQAQAQALAATLDASRHTIALYGPDHRVIATNRITLELTGFASIEDMVGRTYEEVMRSQGRRDYGEDCEWFVREMLAIDRSKPRRYQRRLGDGTVRDIASDPTAEGGFVISVSDVTSLVDAQEEAQRRAGILQVMLENSRQGIVLYDADQRLVAANALAGELMGVPDLLSVPGTTMAQVLAAQRARSQFDGPDEGAAWERLFLGLDRSAPHRMQRSLPDGRRFDLASDPTPDGGFVISVADITPLVRAEAAAEQRAGVLKTMLENNTSGIMMYDRHHRLVAFNALAAELTQMPNLGACIGHTLVENLDLQIRTGNLGADKAGEIQRQRMAALDRTKPHRNQRVAADGRALIVNSDPSPDGGFVISLTDVTPLARAEAEAARRAEILGVILGNIRHGTALFDPQGILTASNARLGEMLDLPESALRPGISHHALIENLFERGEYGTGPKARALADGFQQRPVGAAVRSLRQRPNGEILEVVSDPTPDGGWVVTYTDVTEDRKIRAELEAARVAAEAANRAKSRFLATMSHELRTPLNAVIGFSEVLRGHSTPEQTQEFATAIQEAGRHLLSLIDDILDITRAESGNLPVVLETVSIAPLLEGAARIIGSAVIAGQLRLTMDLPRDLPRLRADERRLRQVLLNLLSNATKFTPAGGEITLSAGLTDAGIYIEVRDTGIGIEAKDLSRVFQPFTQLDSELSRRFPGSGVGLHLCRAMTEAQGGTLELESEPGQGTTARITFPAERIVASERVGLEQPLA